MLKLGLPDRGVLFVVTGPSGVGKSTLVKRAMARIPGISFSVSATTRAPREGEEDGVDYHFLDRDAFKRLSEGGGLLEQAVVYDNYYGTPKATVLDALASGQSILLDIDLLGARQVRARLSEAVLIYLLPPDLATLERRLRARGTDSDDTISRRMQLVGAQLAGCGEFDYLVTNDDLDTAHAAFEAVMLAEMSRRERRESVVERVLADVGDKDSRSGG